MAAYVVDMLGVVKDENDAVELELQAGAYTRPLLSST